MVIGNNESVKLILSNNLIWSNSTSNDKHEQFLWIFKDFKKTLDFEGFNKSNLLIKNI